MFQRLLMVQDRKPALRPCSVPGKFYNIKCYLSFGVNYWRICISADRNEQVCDSYLSNFSVWVWGGPGVNDRGLGVRWDHLSMHCLQEFMILAFAHDGGASRFYECPNGF